MNKVMICAAAMVCALSGCASSKQTYAADGRVAHSINCSGTARNWGMCEEKAGELCGARGYEVTSTNSDQGFVASGSGRNLFASSTMARTMQVICK